MAVEWALLERSNIHSFNRKPERYIALPGDQENPTSVSLLENERVEDVKKIDVRFGKRLMPQDALLMVTQSVSPQDIGKYPTLASANTEENAGKEELELFTHIFGRDSLIFSLDMINEYPQVAKTTILTLASLQGVCQDGSSEEEPGRIIHEYMMPNDPNQKDAGKSKKLNWELPYYGSVDSTLLDLQLVGRYAKFYGSQILSELYFDKNGEMRTVRDSVALAAEWIEKRMERNKHGLVEFYQQSPNGIENQEWRDSREGFHHSDGAIADNTHGIASFSIQVDAYKALQAAAYLLPEKRDEYLNLSSHLKEVILNHFWIEDERGGYFALGSERQANGSRELLEIRTSDMGHILDSDLLEGSNPDVVRKKEMLVKTLFSPEMMAPAGIRTLSKNELRFNPAAYHNGRVWPRENSKIARGLNRYGYFNEARDLHNRNIEIWQQTGVFPESVIGDDWPLIRLGTRITDVKILGEDKTYRLEQPPQLVQAWSVSSIIESLNY